MEVGTKERGQRGRMYGHGLGNVTARVRMWETQKTNWVHFSLNAIEERRFIVRTTIVAFPTVPLLQQAGILYRRPLWVVKWRTKSVFHIWAKEGHMHTYAHSNWASEGHTYMTTDFHHNYSCRERNTDSYPKQSQKATASKTRWQLSVNKPCVNVQKCGIQNVLTKSCLSLPLKHFRIEIVFLRYTEFVQ